MSQRGGLPGHVSQHPLGPMLPGLYQSDDFSQRFTQALDEILAPVMSTLNCIESYFDPYLAPRDFVEWVGSWLDRDTRPAWSDERLRSFVADVVTIYRWYGTPKAISLLVQAYTGFEPEVVESGGSIWAEEADAPAPGNPVPSVTVRVQVDDPGQIDVTTLRQVVSAATPAHVRCDVEVTASGGARNG